MDANKDEAKNAKNSISRTRALKFLNKARRLDPSTEIDEFLSLQPEAKNETTKEKPPLNPLPTSSEVRVAKRKKAKQEQVQVEVSIREKAEQVAVVRDINRKKDYYDILGVEKNSSAEDIRKAYRKLSLKVHPDKNWAPGAEDSFKKLSNAFQCLSRRKYDLQKSPVSVSRRRSSGEVIKEVVIHLIFGVGAFILLNMVDEPFSMEKLMRVARDRAENRFKLSGSVRLKYEYEGKIIYLPKEDELGADNELRTCIHRLLSVGEEPIVIRVEFS